MNKWIYGCVWWGEVTRVFNQLITEVKHNCPWPKFNWYPHGFNSLTPQIFCGSEKLVWLSGWLMGLRLTHVEGQRGSCHQLSDPCIRTEGKLSPTL